MPLLSDAWWHLLAVAAAIIVGSAIAHRLVYPILLRMASRATVTEAVVKRVKRAAGWTVPAVAIQLALQGMPQDEPGLAFVEHLNGVLVITMLTWLAVSAVQGVANGVILLHPAEVSDNLSARRVQTQARVLARIASGAVLVAGLAFVLMTFQKARQLGASVLASAGVVGLIAGIAAKSVFSNLLAGLHIALAQPIRLDDVLIIEGEWGRVEEITATYVVLRIWDERRLIIPLGWFMEHPFQNWTRTSADLLGTVMLWVDFAMPVEALRQEAERLCRASKNWDQRVCVVQVTDTSDRAMQVRVLVSSANSGASTCAANCAKRWWTSSGANIRRRCRNCAPASTARPSRRRAGWATPAAPRTSRASRQRRRCNRTRRRPLEVTDGRATTRERGTGSKIERECAFSASRRRFRPGLGRPALIDRRS